MKEREVQAIQEIEKWLKEREIQQQKILVTEGTTLEANLSTNGTTLDASLVNEGATLEACLVTKGATLEACLVTKGIEMDNNLVVKESTVDSSTSSEQLNECNRSRRDAAAQRMKTEVLTMKAAIQGMMRMLILDLHMIVTQ
ncbi:hypothetical protein Tco_0764995 [Tanacetum coccineum]